ncbi:MAG: type III toxin-antitoxin system ToxN/AbiQ family toxin [Clostridia bacterium]|nr:type III toxin-antitoxin system ToxN/AbiQ family toxin [Clostridia bacterium]
MELEIKVKNGHLLVYEVDAKYRNYLEQFENKVSQKDNRKFYGILIKKDKYEYCIPFTSKVKHRNSKLTINIKNRNLIIAQLLLNNMIPVTEENIVLIDIEKEKYVDYLKSEIIYLNNEKVVKEIINKVQKMFEVLENKKHKDYAFYKYICCDFNKLEEIYKNYNK